MEPYRILVVDDDKEIRDAIEIYLRNEGFDVLHAKDGLETLSILREYTIHVIVLDIMMPNLDGLSATFRIREENNIPIILLSAKSEDTDKILGLQIGADDYVTKPFNPLELIARVKAQIRRYLTLGTAVDNEKAVQLHGLTLDGVSREVTVHGEAVHFTPMEYKIFELLITHPGRVFSIQEIYELVWKEPYYRSSDNTVAVHVRKIREKIEIDAKNPRHLKVVWGIGYKMEK
ncbi:response regulator transcription factor [Alicyclobacillus curvatus]|nr:response regulator transcription factor [Alicyclobacillus curvatus]